MTTLRKTCWMCRVSSSGGLASAIPVVQRRWFWINSASPSPKAPMAAGQWARFRQDGWRFGVGNFLGQAPPKTIQNFETYLAQKPFCARGSRTAFGFFVRFAALPRIPFKNFPTCMILPTQNRCRPESGVCWWERLWQEYHHPTSRTFLWCWTDAGKLTWQEENPWTSFMCKGLTFNDIPILFHGLPLPGWIILCKSQITFSKGSLAQTDAKGINAYPHQPWMPITAPHCTAWTSAQNRCNHEQIQ